MFLTCKIQPILLKSRHFLKLAKTRCYTTISQFYPINLVATFLLRHYSKKEAFCKRAISQNRSDNIFMNVIPRHRSIKTVLEPF